MSLGSGRAQGRVSPPCFGPVVLMIPDALGLRCSAGAVRVSGAITAPAKRAAAIRSVVGRRVGMLGNEQSRRSQSGRFSCVRFLKRDCTYSQILDLVTEHSLSCR